MKESDRGYICVEGYLPSVLEKLPMFNDTSFDKSKAPLPAGYEGMLPLVTPVSEYGERTLYAIKEYNPLLDSSNMRCEDWARMATDIFEAYEHWDAFIVLHGTDTMAFSGAALSFMLSNINKTVIITGSQIPLSRPRNDAINNLLGSLNIAGHFDIPEVRQQALSPLSPLLHWT
jgi:lysophospholipase